MHFTAVASAALLAISPVLAQQAISQTTYNNIIQYTRFARASYAQTCTTPPNGSVVLQNFDDATTDGHAKLFRWDQAKQLIISFRGTYDQTNWNSDLDFNLVNLSAPGTSCSQCQVHEGFQKIHNALAPAIITAIKNAQAANPTYSVIIVGHSLGGALASIATASLTGSGIKVASTYTYGEPRNGNSQWGQYIFQLTKLANYYRVTHANDAVPTLPPNFINYIHHGNEYWEKASGYNNTVATTVLCPAPFIGENSNCVLSQNSNSEINRAHVTYSNNVIGNVLYIQDCGAPYYH